MTSYNLTAPTVLLIFLYNDNKAASSSDVNVFAGVLQEDTSTITLHVPMTLFRLDAQQHDCITLTLKMKPMPKCLNPAFENTPILQTSVGTGFPVEGWCCHRHVHLRASEGSKRPAADVTVAYFLVL